MALKIFKAVWFLSVLVCLAVFLYVYASLPEEVMLREGERISISREVLFYTFLILFAFLAGLVFAVRKLYFDEHFLTWFHGLIISLNFFLVIALNFASLINSGENFRYERIGYVIYGSLALMTCWAAAWPLYAGIRRLRGK